MKRFDVNCFSGFWPFHSTRFPDCAHLSVSHKAAGIDGGLVTSLQTVFYLDPLTAAEELSKELPAGYGQVFAINPQLPAAAELCAHACTQLKIKGIRLVPTFHNFSWDDPRTQAVLSVAEKYQLPLFITLNLEDPRLDYMVQQTPLDMDKLSGVLLDLPDVPVIITNAFLKNIVALSGSIRQRRRMFAETSSLNSPLLALDQAADHIGYEHLMFGSCAHLQTLSSSVQNMLHCDLTEAQLQAVWYDHAAQIFQL